MGTEEIKAHDWKRHFQVAVTNALSTWQKFLGKKN
jgi:hypothetical protein